MQQEPIAELIAAHEAHLRQLFLTRAQLGAAAPPHIQTEIDRIQKELNRLQPGPEPLDDMTMYRVLMAECMRLDTAIGQTRREVKELREHIDRRFDALITLLVNTRAPAASPRPARRANGGE